MSGGNRDRPDRNSELGIADVLLFSLAHPGWEFAFQPQYAAYPSLIEPLWKVLRSLALKGRRFETWEAIYQAIGATAEYWHRFA